MNSRAIPLARRERAVVSATEMRAQLVAVEEAVQPRKLMAPRLLDIYAAAFVDRDGGIEDARAAG